MTRAVIGLSLSPTWLRGRLWQQPDSRVESMFGSDLYVRAARLAERAHLDFVFKPDAGFLDPAALREGIGFSSLDPIVVLSAIAQQTERIGLVPTVSSTFAHPYPTARQLQSLDAISAGRLGWNVVTSLGGACNYGDARPPEDLYANAADFVTMVERLRGTFPADALLMDRTSGVFADISRIGSAAQVGRYASDGPVTVPARSPQPLPLLHAGTSPESREFAARFADAVFAMTGTITDGIEQRTALREAAQAAGRRDRVLLLPGLSLCLAQNTSQAAELADAIQAPQHVRHWSVVGTPRDAVDSIIERLESGAADGFIALPTGSWHSLELFTEEVVPALAEAGYARSAYDTATLRDHLGTV